MLVFVGNASVAIIKLVLRLLSCIGVCECWCVWICDYLAKASQCDMGAVSV